MARKAWRPCASALAKGWRWQSSASDTLLECVPVERRDTLLAKQDATGVYQWNVILQGIEAETVFFDY